MNEIDHQQLFLALKSSDFKEYDINLILQELINRIADMDATIMNDITKYDELGSIILSKLFESFKPSATTTNLLLIVLNNISNNDEACQVLITYISLHIEQFHHMLIKFLDYYPQAEDKSIRYDDDWSSLDPWQYVASIVCNISRYETGRQYIADKSENYLSKLVIQMRSRNIIRRRGSIGTIRTLLFDTTLHEWLLNEINILPQLLYHLVIYKPFTDEEKLNMDYIIWMQASNPSKQSEPDMNLLNMILECILLLCQDCKSRIILRQRKVYFVVRNLDEAIENEEINSTIYEIVNLLMRDEQDEVQSDK